jgi:hypothetical protein
MPVSIQAPAGSHWEYDEVKTAKGTQSLGEVPLLVWDSVHAATAHYGEDGIKDIFNGTSLRVSFQAIARRGRAKGMTDDQIAEAQTKFRPGTRAVGQSTPVSRARNAANAAASKINGDIVAAFLAKVADGSITAEDMEALAK